MGSTAPSRTGFRNLFECHEVASGPVSASPSPTTTATIRSGLSNAAPNPCERLYPPPPPFMTAPRSLRRARAPEPTRKRELLEELLHPRLILALIRIHLRINS